MSGPYGYDVEFGLVLIGAAFIVLTVSAVIEVYLDARKGKR